MPKNWTEYIDYNKLKEIVTRENNIKFDGVNYRYVDDLYKLSTTGFSTKDALIKNKKAIRFDAGTFILMRNRYIKEV